MFDWVRQKVLEILRVPPEPAVPEGTPASVLTFRAGRNFYRWLVLAWAFSHLGVVAGAIFAYYFTWRLIGLGPKWLQFLYGAVEVAGLFTIAIGLLLTFVAVKWNYELRWYIVTDRSLRIRRGVWNVEELTLTFANIQEISVTSGPVQKLLGIANVEVRAAGGGGGGPDGERKGHVARFEGVDNAAAIRDLIVERLRTYRDLGLGGGEEWRGPGAASLNSATLRGLQSVLAETKALRCALQGTSVKTEPAPRGG
jgi:membrane protein YdbS with pleckstrin-like domain